MTQFIPNTFYGIQNFLDNLNACNAQNECSYTPKADYYEVDNGFMLEVELPGVKKEDLDVQVEKNIITVKATRARKESKFTYERSFRLSADIDNENIKVSLETANASFCIATTKEDKPGPDHPPKILAQTQSPPPLRNHT